MQTKRNVFSTVRTEGALLPADLLRRIVDGDQSIGGLSPRDYHLAEGEKLTEAANRAWNRLLAAWGGFRDALAKLPEGDPAIGVTRDRWLLPLFAELGYGRLVPAKAMTVGDRTYPISHAWAQAPIHLVGVGVELDRKTAGVAGAAKSSPHSLVQEFLNRSDAHLWGIVSNGYTLRLLRDSVSLVRQSYVEFDLRTMMDQEVYADFVLLWHLLHQSRVEADRPEACWLERWTEVADEQGARALDGLRMGVEKAIVALGSGFLAHRGSRQLRADLRSGALSTQDYYRQLLRTVYRLIFLYVAEDRDFLFDPAAPEEAKARYREFYSLDRLRALADRRPGTRHSDLWHSVRLVFGMLKSDTGCPELGLPALNSFLWSTEATEALVRSEISNRDLLEAIRALAFVVDGGVRRPVDFKNLGSEELGSVYESLLELHPEVNAEAGTFALVVASGNERKATGSYYTPESLIQQLLDTALDPVLDAVVAGAKSPEEAEAAILRLKAIDTACGSGHFLVGAAHRMAQRLASVRTGEEAPAPEAIRRALRDVIGRCIYGVDINPMAVELCKVSLWMEALEPGKPLSFLDHHILVGNGLLGATPALLAKGIPGEAFEVLEGDDKKLVSALKKRNKEELSGAQDLFGGDLASWVEHQAVEKALAEVRVVPDSTVAGIHEKQRRYEDLLRSDAYRSGKLLADAWCAAFVWHKTPGAVPAITTDAIHRLRTNPAALSAAQRAEVERLAEQYQFLHWHLAFPDVFHVPAEGEAPENDAAGWSGGFDVVLGNPPWDQVQLDPREFFAVKHPEIAQAPHMAARNKALQQLEKDDPDLYGEYVRAKRTVEGAQHFLHGSGRYPHTSRGRLNLAPLFADLGRTLISSRGRAGLVVPTGIATDSFTQHFFRDVVESSSLIALYDFENRERLFPGVDSRQKFCLLTMGAPGSSDSSGADFAFFLHSVGQVADVARRFKLTAADLALLNPNTLTCPIFRTARDAELTKAVYRRVPVFGRETDEGLESSWDVRPTLMFMMNAASGDFRSASSLEQEGWRRAGNIYSKGGERHLPLYEAKMIAQYDHRASDIVISATAAVRQAQPADISREEHEDPLRVPSPRYWVPERAVNDVLPEQFTTRWYLGFADVTSATNHRTMIATLLPKVGAGHTLPVLLYPATGDARAAACLLAVLNSFALDYLGRQKLGGLHYSFTVLRQLPILPPDAFSDDCPWEAGTSLRDWVSARVLELVYTSEDMRPFAEDCEYGGQPFAWDEERRFMLRCELDAALFHLYDFTRSDVEYVLETFPIVRRDDVASHARYRTKEQILSLFDQYGPVPVAAGVGNTSAVPA